MTDTSDGFAQQIRTKESSGSHGLQPAIKDSIESTARAEARAYRKENLAMILTISNAILHVYPGSVLRVVHVWPIA
jgi:hypothetical protein